MVVVSSFLKKLDSTTNNRLLLEARKAMMNEKRFYFSLSESKHNLLSEFAKQNNISKGG